MSVTIGRAGTGGVTLDDPDSVRITGSTLELSGDTLPASVAAMKALRDQLVGLTVNPDEPVVPFTWSEDSSLDGFVRVAAAQAEYVPTSLSTGYVRWSATLERVNTDGVFEVKVVAAILTNNHSVTISNYDEADDKFADIHGIPGADLGDWGVTLSGPYALTTATGDLGVWFGYQNYGLNASSWMQYVVTPGDYYDGACLIEASIGGTWYPISGRSLPRDVTATDVRISNGILRVGWTATRLQVAPYDGSQWDAAKDYKVGIYDWADAEVDAWSAVSRVAILRNSPEQIVVRLWITIYSRHHTVDLTLTRGRRTVTGYAFAPNQGGFNPLGVAVATAEASTSQTWGIVATSADAAGNKFGLWTPHYATLDTTNGEIATYNGSNYRNIDGGAMFVLCPRCVTLGSPSLVTPEYDALVSVGAYQRAVML
jgi:hypothetical protein